ncbi:MAG: response regulator transcription factor [Chitinophagaceae bacterium]|nr:response regulator transcription factor [Chitinophagaceae bacterium]
MKVLIVEDELAASEFLEDSINDLRLNIEVVAVLRLWKDTADWLARNPSPDLILMDINLADGSAFEIFNKIKISTPVVYITAYDKYILQSLKNNGIQYLLKPYQLADLHAVFSKYRELTGHFLKQNELKADKQSRSFRTRLLVKQGNNYLTIQTEKIAFIIFDQKTVFAVDAFNKKQMTQYSNLSELANELDPVNFYKANRQYILNAEFIDSIRIIENGKIAVKLTIPHEPVIVSQDNAMHFKKWLNNEVS